MTNPLGVAASGHKETSKAAEKTLVSADGFIGEQSDVRYDLSVLLQELTEMARSIWDTRT